MPRFRTTREQILTARQQEDVDRLVQEAVAHLSPEEIKSLPQECRSVIAGGERDIHSAAVVLLQCDLRYRGEPGIGETLRQLAELFACASVRVSQIEHRRHPA